MPIDLLIAVFRDALLMVGMAGLMVSVIIAGGRTVPWVHSKTSRMVFLAGLGLYVASQVSDVAYRVFCDATGACSMRIDLHDSVFREALRGAGVVALMVSAVLTGGRAFPWVYSDVSKRVFFVGLGFCAASQAVGSVCRIIYNT